MEFYTLQGVRVSKKGEKNTQYNNYSLNLHFQGETEGCLWNLREGDFHRGTIDPTGRLIATPGLPEGTIFKGKIENLTSGTGNAYTRFKGDVHLGAPPEQVDHDLAPMQAEPALASVAVDDICDLWLYLAGRAQIGFQKLNIQADAQAVNAAAATIMIDIQKRGLKIPAKVKE